MWNELKKVLMKNYMARKAIKVKHRMGHQIREKSMLSRHMNVKREVLISKRFRGLCQEDKDPRLI